MRLVRCKYNSAIRWGVLKDSRVALLKEPPFERIIPSKKSISLSRVKLTVPAEPTKIVLVGLNYRDHAAELNMPLPIDPVIFLKPPTALLAHGQKIVLPGGVDRLDYEAELALVIRKEAKNVSAEDALKYILGYTCLNDVTARDVQKKDGQWTRAKSFDTFCPVGPWVETDFDPGKSTVICRLNGAVRQRSQTTNLIFSVPYLVSFVSRVMRLFPGDIISTGTPPGVGAMKPGDHVEVEVCGIGVLKNSVVSENKAKRSHR
ncbi:MAG TPA: fumarylacetoacetate hydrolase family protein [Candidatus Omnitrophota bacterium]|nr:fumarylacetoacetate hydrolase family protein [Candidatus Omnitrophota bacterium]